MIAVTSWNRWARSQLASWAPEPNSALLAAFLLRSSDEPYYAAPHSLAVLKAGRLIGRFTYRVGWDGAAFVGLALDPACRGQKLAGPSMRAALVKLAKEGFARATATVALANKPSERMLSYAGFRLVSLQWRDLPAEFDAGLLAGLPNYSVLVGSPCKLLYASLHMDLRPDMYFEPPRITYAELAQQ